MLISLFCLAGPVPPARVSPGQAVIQLIKELHPVGTRTLLGEVEEGAGAELGEVC